MESRIYRALNQKIFLLRAIFKDDTWTFYVQGTSYNTYEVYFSKSEVYCTCPDCQTRNYTCKHIIFIIGKVAKNKKLLGTLTLNLKSVKLNKELSETLEKRLSKRLESVSLIEIIEEDKAEDCIICFDSITSINKSEQQCKICKIVYHSKCINKWLNSQECCCHCKQAWKNNKDLDELNKFVEFNK
jgi:ribosomal protein L18E